jgi:hypothetical protein
VSGGGSLVKRAGGNSSLCLESARAGDLGIGAYKNPTKNGYEYVEQRESSTIVDPIYRDQKFNGSDIKTNYNTTPDVPPFPPHTNPQKFFQSPTADRNIYPNPSPTKPPHKSSDQTPLLSQKSPTHLHYPKTHSETHPNPLHPTPFPSQIHSLKSEITNLTQELVQKSKKLSKIEFLQQILVENQETNLRGSITPGVLVPGFTVSDLEKKLGKVLGEKKRQIERVEGVKEGVRRANKKNEYSMRKALSSGEYGGNTEALLNENKNLVGMVKRRKAQVSGKLAESEKATSKRCDAQIDIEAKLLIYR